jgi:hypothetical protein
LRERITLAMKNGEAPHGASNDGGEDNRSRRYPSLYSLVFSCTPHHCSEPRDKVISLLGLIPGSSHLIDYSTPIDQYFEKVCEYTFTEAHITEPLARYNFRVYLGYSLRLADYPCISMVETPSPPRQILTKRQFLAFRNTNIPYELPTDIEVLSELVYFDSKLDIEGVLYKF